MAKPLVRISVCVEVEKTVRHFEVHRESFDEAYRELVKRLNRAGYQVAAPATSIGVAGTAS